MLKKIQENKGTALILATTVLVVLAIISASFTIMAASNTQGVSKSRDFEQVYDILRSGVAHNLMELNLRQGSGSNFVSEGQDTLEAIDPTKDGVMGWTNVAGGQYKVTIPQSTNSNNPDFIPANILPSATELGRSYFLVYGRFNNTRRRALVVAQASITTINEVVEAKPFVSALYQGSANPFEWGGTGSNKDSALSFPPTGSSVSSTTFTGLTGKVPADIYSGGDLSITGGAVVESGLDSASNPVPANAQSGGTVSNSSTDTGTTTITETPNTLINNPTAPDYTQISNVVSVSSVDFTRSVPSVNTPSNGSVARGGFATPNGTDARHIFTMNPRSTSYGGRRTEVDGTDRNDFFLEDVYSGGDLTMSGSNGQNAVSAYDANEGFNITLADTGNNKVYLVDGNMWLHSSPPFTLKMNTSTTGAGDPDPGTRATFAVKGNIYLSDNFLYQDLQKDAVAFIALKQDVDIGDFAGNDSSIGTAEGSGNITFGDALFGTSHRFAGIMYAENDFNTINNDVAGLAVYGNMTAGGDINITNGTGSDRNPLTVHYDARLDSRIEDIGGTKITLPGLFTDPTSSGSITAITSYEQSTFTIKGLRLVGEGKESDWN